MEHGHFGKDVYQSWMERTSDRKIHDAVHPSFEREIVSDPPQVPYLSPAISGVESEKMKKQQELRILGVQWGEIYGYKLDKNRFQKAMSTIMLKLATIHDIS